MPKLDNEALERMASAFFAENLMTSFMAQLDEALISRVRKFKKVLRSLSRNSKKCIGGLFKSRNASEWKVLNSTSRLSLPRM